MDRLRALQAFVRVAELGSFTAAGRELRVTQSQVSRAVRELEREVESQLFTRSTRRVVLTPEGQRYLHGVRDALHTLDAANDAVRTDSRAVSGTLRVTAPAELGEYLTPVMTALIAEHPALSIDSLLTDRLVDLIDEGFDVAIRVGPMAPSALRARRLGTNLAVLCASPAYARAHELPRHPRDLREHAFVLFTGKRNPERLTLVDGRGHAAQVRLAGRLRTNELRVARLAAMDGAGITALPMVMLARDLAEERLVRVLPGWSLRAAPVHAVFPARTPQPARLTAFLDAMAQALRPSGRGRPDRRARGE